METFAKAPDGALLQWTRYKPSGTGPWPAAILIHGGGFHGGGPGSCKQAGTTVGSKASTISTGKQLRLTNRSATMCAR